jgi:hypothetical protein
MTDGGTVYQPGADRVTAPVRPRGTYVGYKAFGGGPGAVLLEPDVAHKLRSAAEFATQERRITGGLLYGRGWTDDQGPYTVVGGYLEAGPGENPGDRFTADGDTFTLSPPDLRLLREDAGRMYTASFEVGWWRTLPGLGEFNSQDFETQAALVGPNGVGLLVYGSGIYWGTAYLGPDGLAPDSAGSLAAVPADAGVREPAPEPEPEPTDRFDGPHVVDLAAGEHVIEEEPPPGTIPELEPEPEDLLAAQYPTGEYLAEEPLPAQAAAPPAAGAPAPRQTRTRVARRVRAPSRPRIPSRARRATRVWSAEEEGPEYSAGPGLPTDVVLVVGALALAVVAVAVIIGVLVHSGTVAVIIGVIGLLAVFSTVWMSRR